MVPILPFILRAAEFVDTPPADFLPPSFPRVVTYLPSAPEGGDLPPLEKIGLPKKVLTYPQPQYCIC